MGKEEERFILYISSVPVNQLYSGASFMYRLFQGHEKKIAILQGIKINEESQLDNVKYNYYEPALKRLGLTRFREIYNLANIIKNYFFIPSQARQLMKNNRPKAVLTVSNGLLWILAYRVAKKNKLPLVVIVHDDMNYNYPKKKLSGKLVNFLFTKVYRYARLRFCVSELMSSEYFLKYNVHSETLYPLQGKDQFSATVKKNSSKKISVAYAGSLDAAPYTKMILALAAELKKTGAVVMIFANVFPEMLKPADNIINFGFLQPENLRKKMEESANILFVPFSFDDNGSNVELAFPSKMADYSLIAKPLLIWAPASCAISVWFKSLPEPIGILIENAEGNGIASAIEKLSDPLINSAWGLNSFRTGKEYFGNKKQQDFFYDKINAILN